MAVRLQRSSRLRFGDLLNVDDVEFWDILDLPVLPVSPDDLFYTVLTGDRIDTIATKFYGDPVLWWVLAVANDMELLPSDLSAGEQIRVPSPTFVSQVLFNDAKVG